MSTLFNRSMELSERAARHVARLQRRQTKALAKAVLTRRNPAVADSIAARLQALEPIVARTLQDAQLHAFIGGAKSVSALMPVAVQRSWGERPGIIPLHGPIPPRGGKTSPPGNGGNQGGLPPSGLLPAGPGGSGPPPAVRFPQIEAGTRIIGELTPLLPADFEAASDQARRTAFTVARAQTLEAVQAVQQAVADDLRGGGTLASFRDVVDEALDGALSDRETETLYRTYTGRGYSAGQVAVWDNPFVRSEVPYLLYSATHDSRVRPDHLAMERMGLNGTAVYRADDPIWDVFWPPWAWNCRCVVIPLDIHAAAERGVREAREWLATGQPPAFPEFVTWPSFRPPKGWVPSGRSLSVAF